MLKTVISCLIGAAFAAALGYELSLKVSAELWRLLFVTLGTFLLAFFIAWRVRTFLAFSWGFTIFALLGSEIYLANKEMVQTEGVIVFFSLIPLSIAYLIRALEKEK